MVGLAAQESKRISIYGVDDMLSKKDVANHLGIGRDAVNVLFKTKGFPVIYFGRTPLVSKSKYQEWISKNTGKRISLIKN